MAATGFLQNPIEYLKGVGPLRADLLKKELGIFTYEDLLNHFPFRHIDRTSVSAIAALKQEADFAQVAGVVISRKLYLNGIGALSGEDRHARGNHPSVRCGIGIKRYGIGLC